MNRFNLPKEKLQLIKCVIFAFSAIVISVVAAISYNHKNIDVEVAHEVFGEEVIVVETPIEYSVHIPVEETDPVEVIVEEPEPEHEPEIPPVITITGEDRDKIATMLAKTIYGESRGIESVTEQACIVWTVLNRVDDDRWDNTIEKVLTKPHQFCYRSHFPTVDDFGRDLKALAEDILIRWEREHNGEDNIGRVLAPEYVFYHGKHGHNWFRTKFIGDGNYWDYSLESPYEN